MNLIQRMRCLFLGVTVLLVPSAVYGEVKLARIFTDHMVLQQEMPIRVWGFADAKESFEVKIDGKSATTTERSGLWGVSPT